jgi:hypothetical protein
MTARTPVDMMFPFMDADACWNGVWDIDVSALITLTPRCLAGISAG